MPFEWRIYFNYFTANSSQQTWLYLQLVVEQCKTEFRVGDQQLRLDKKNYTAIQCNVFSIYKTWQFLRCAITTDALQIVKQAKLNDNNFLELRRRCCVIFKVSMRLNKKQNSRKKLQRTVVDTMANSSFLRTQQKWYASQVKVDPRSYERN